jgi:hypothetical protein
LPVEDHLLSNLSESYYSIEVIICKDIFIKIIKFTRKEENVLTHV